MSYQKEMAIRIGERITAARNKLHYRSQQEFVEALRSKYPDAVQPRVSEAEKGGNVKWQDRIIDFLISEGIDSDFFNVDLPVTTKDKIENLEKRVIKVEEENKTMRHELSELRPLFRVMMKVLKENE